MSVASTCPRIPGAGGGRDVRLFGSLTYQLWDGFFCSFRPKWRKFFLSWSCLPCFLRFYSYFDKQFVFVRANTNIFCGLLFVIIRTKKNKFDHNKTAIFHVFSSIFSCFLWFFDYFLTIFHVFYPIFCSYRPKSPNLFVFIRTNINILRIKTNKTITIITEKISIFWGCEQIFHVSQTNRPGQIGHFPA